MIDTKLFAERTIPLERMKGVKLMNRVDRKFVTCVTKLDRLLKAALRCGYLAQEVGDGVVAEYDTIYLDTHSLDNYLTHHNGHLTRQKVRVRKYLDNGETFLEIKNKSNDGRTRKKRISIPQENIASPFEAPGAAKFLEGRLLYIQDDYSPSLRTTFKRITLVNPEMTERITIDTGLRFENLRNGRRFDMDGLMIVELKQDGTKISTMRSLLAREGIRRMGFSKYCIGTAVTSEGLKQNRFKEKIIYTKKLINKYVELTTSTSGI